MRAILNIIFNSRLMYGWATSRGRDQVVKCRGIEAVGRGWSGNKIFIDIRENNSTVLYSTVQYCRWSDVFWDAI